MVSSGNDISLFKFDCLPEQLSVPRTHSTPCQFWSTCYTHSLKVCERVADVVQSTVSVDTSNIDHVLVADITLTAGVLSNVNERDFRVSIQCLTKMTIDR